MATKRWKAAKLESRLGPAPVVDTRWFKANNYQWARHTLIPGVPRPAYPAHITTKEFPGFFDEIARLKLWRQRKLAGIKRPAVGLWRYGRFPLWAAEVSKAMDKANVPHVPPPIPPVLPPVPIPNAQLMGRAQQVIFTAWRPLDGVHSKVSLTADVNVASNPTRHIAESAAAVVAAHNRGFEASAWANQSQVGIQQLVSFGKQIGADYLIWQAETIGEFEDVGVNQDGSLRPDSPITWGPLVLIGNANAWTTPQRQKAAALVYQGRLAFIQEVYTNEGAPWPEASGTQGVPAASISPGVGWGRYLIQLPEYKQHTPSASWPGISPYIAETFDASSWAVLPY